MADPLWQYLGRYETLSQEELVGVEQPIAAARALRRAADRAAGSADADDGIELRLSAARGADRSRNARPPRRLAADGQHHRVDGRSDVDRPRAPRPARVGRDASTAGGVFHGVPAAPCAPAACAAGMWPATCRGRSASPVVVAYLTPSASTLWARLHGAAPDQIIHAEDGSGLSLIKSDPAERRNRGLCQWPRPERPALWRSAYCRSARCRRWSIRRPVSVAIIGLGSGRHAVRAGGRPETQRIDSIEIIAPELETLQQLDRRRHYPALRMLLQDAPRAALVHRRQDADQEGPHAAMTSSRRTRSAPPAPTPAISIPSSISSCCAIA